MQGIWVHWLISHLGTSVHVPSTDRGPRPYSYVVLPYKAGIGVSQQRPGARLRQASAYGCGMISFVATGSYGHWCFCMAFKLKNYRYQTPVIGNSQHSASALSGANKKKLYRTLGPALHRGWAKIMLDRCRDLFQHPNQPRPTAAEATEEDEEEARAFYHHPHPPGYGVRPLEGAPCLEFSCWLLVPIPPPGREAKIHQTALENRERRVGKLGSIGDKSRPGGGRGVLE